MKERWISKILKRPGGSGERAAQRTTALLEQARGVPRAEQGTIFRELGELCLGSGQKERALAYFGQAIDAHLEIGRYEAAVELCRYVISRVPEVVRTRCTLAFLLLGSGDTWSFRRELAEYIRAAERKGDQAMAIARLRMMASVTQEPAMAAIIERYLARLGDFEQPFHIGDSSADRSHRVVGKPMEQRDHWALMLRQTISGPVVPAR